MSGCRLSPSRDRRVDNRRFGRSHPEQGDAWERDGRRTQAEALEDIKRLTQKGGKP
jgi:hypothetical protein